MQDIAISVTKKKRSSILLLFIIFPLVFGILSTAFSSKGFAATVRTIEVNQVKGTAYVKRGGGLQSYQATEGMILHEGDHLITTAGSNVVLLTEDRKDEITVSESTELYISTLDKVDAAYKTKLELWAGSAYVKVTKLKKATDEFIVETPSSEFNVRGTHFTLTTNPLTGETRMFVNAGVVQANLRKESSTSGVNIYPTQQVNLYPNDPSTPPQSNVTIMDPAQFVQHASPAIIEALIRNNAQAEQERQEFLEQQKELLEQGNKESVPEGLDLSNNDDLQRLAKNLDNLTNTLVNESVKKGLVTEKDIQGLINQANQQSERKIQLGQQNDLELTAKQQLAQQKLQELERQKQQEQQKKQEEREQQQQQLTNVINQIKEAMQQLEQQNQQAQAEKQKQAVEKYLETLTDEEKERFLKDREKINNKTPVPSPINENDNSGGGNQEPGGHVNPVVIESISPITTIVNWKEEYTLPSIVIAEMSNGTTREVNVSWNETNVDTTMTGVYTFRGTVAGFSGEVILSLIVEVPLDTAVPLEPNQPIRFTGGIILEPDETVDGQEIIMRGTEELPNDNGLILLGNLYWFEVASGDVFDLPVKLSLPIQGGTDLENVGIYLKNFDTPNWESAFFTTDAGNGRIHAEVSLFNRYFGVFEAKTPQIQMSPTEQSNNHLMEFIAEFDLPVELTEEADTLMDQIEIRNSKNEEFLHFETVFLQTQETNEDSGIFKIQLYSVQPSEEYTITIPANMVKSLHGVPNEAYTYSFVTEEVTY
ncbi:Ig-like domain-containing protein [Cytobacillus sp. FJAT-54145]|uniref:Ig-like domain-containing protein n=1 Tax=Cytobacillus spartinae TaxID=3299023 RepID=A0ABW6KGB5_9BACI